LVGILIGFLIGGFLTATTWRFAFLFTGIPGLLLALLAWKLREPRQNQGELEEEAAQGQLLEEIPISLEPRTPTNPLLQMRDLLRIKTLVVLIVMQIFAFFVLSVATTFLPTYLQQTDLPYHMSSRQASLFSGAVIVLAGLIGTVLGGYLADWLSSRHAGSRVLVCGIGFLLSAPLFVLSLLAQNFALYALFFILTTILITFYTGPATAATQDVAPSALRASAVAVSLLIAHLFGDAFSPTLVGVLARSFDPTGGAHFVQNAAGHDLGFAFLITATPALIIAGLVGIFGARWMKGDVAAALEADRIAKQGA
jgi:sugar phosphate permease